ncbi:GPI inositol-deacylase [Schizosaccharomyces pombe]
MKDDKGRSDTVNGYYISNSKLSSGFYKRNNANTASNDEKPNLEQNDIPSVTSSGSSTPSSISIEKEIKISKGNVIVKAIRSWSLYVAIIAILLLLVILHSFQGRPQDNGCGKSYVWPSYVRFVDFDERYTRFANKYSLYLYREKSVEESDEPSGIPILFIPGNAGSYKQVRAFAAQAAHVYANAYAEDADGTLNAGKLVPDFFVVDFNEDFSAFHGQTLLDQAEYVNDAIPYILSLYRQNRKISSEYDNEAFPPPTSVILLGHSMGGIVAQATFTMKNYVDGSVNTLITLATPHAMAPLPFDRHLVEFYESIKNFWSQSFLLSPEENSLDDVLLVSIAGGGLDTHVVPEYSSISTFVPPSNGLMVFTSGIPSVWAEIDHQAMAWCENFRRVLIRGIFAIMDARTSKCTVPLNLRKELLSRAYIQGSSFQNDITQISKPIAQYKALDLDLTYVYSEMPGQLLFLNQLGVSYIRHHIFPIPKPTSSIDRFELLTDQPIDLSSSNIKVLACRLDPKIDNTISALLENGNNKVINANCHLLRELVTLLPASTAYTSSPYGGDSFYNYVLPKEKMDDYHFILVSDDSKAPASGFVVGGFSNVSLDPKTIKGSQIELFKSGRKFQFDTKGSISKRFRFPGIQSSIMAYTISVTYELYPGAVPQKEFTPMLKQSIESPFETKYHVNMSNTELSVHGISPFMEFFGKESEKSLTLEFFLNPAIYKSVYVSIQPSYYRSAGRLLMRYRTLLASFPVVVISLAAYNQFRYFHYGSAYLSMSAALEVMIRKGLIKLLFLVSILSIAFSYLISRVELIVADGADPVASWKIFAMMVPKSFWKQNHLLFGLQTAQFWFLAPLLTLMFVGLVITASVIILCVMHLLAFIYGIYLRYKGLTFTGVCQAVKFSFQCLRTRNTRKLDHGEFKKLSSFLSQRNMYYANPSLCYVYGKKHMQARIIGIMLLLLMAMTVVPFQLVYGVALCTQTVTTAKALHLARFCTKSSHYRKKLWDFYNFSCTITILMLLLAPLDFPVLIVWARNLSMHWSIPFPTHHNFFSIIPFILLTEILRTGKMLPRLNDVEYYINNVFLFLLSFYSLIYGAEKPYLIHNVVGLYFFWLLFLYAKNGFFVQNISKWPIIPRMKYFIKHKFLRSIS